jgi:chemotaxis protein CheD
VKDIIDVNTGRVKVADSGVLRAVALGSCIAVAAYDRVKRIAGIAHVMLPNRAPAKCEEKNKYAFDAIESLLEMMSPADLDDLDVCLVGAGNVLKKPDDTICDSNTRSVNVFLAERGIAVRASVLGGVRRKSVFMDIASGQITYTVGDGQEQYLWEAI